MTTYSKVNCTHQTLVAATADTVNLSGGFPVVAVTNRGSNDISVTFGLNGATAATPVSLADETYIVQAGTAKVFNFTADLGAGAGEITQVKLISAGTPAYSVEAY